MSRIKEKYGRLQKPFTILLIIYIISIYPIIRANFNYLDDLGRVMKGYRGWDNFSRFISYHLSVVIHGNDYLTDISPIPQLLAVAICAASGVMLIQLFNKNEKVNVCNVIATIPLGLSPYFLECLSYKYDSPYMALSIFVSIFPFLLYGKSKKDKALFCVATVIGAIAMCTSYQAASGIIPMVALFLALDLWNEREAKEAVILVGLAAVSYLIGLLIFKIFILVPVDDYASSSLLPLNEIIPGGIENLKKYYTFFLSDFRGVWKFLIAIITICFVARNVYRSKQNKIVSGIVSAVVLVVAAALAFGLYPVLKSPIFSARAMYGIGILIALIGVKATSEYRINIAKMGSLSLAWCFITFSCTYGNALSEQKEYVDFRVEAVINALNELDVMNTDIMKKVRIYGNAGKSPVVENMINYGDYGTILGRLVQQSLGGEWSWDYQCFNYYKLENIEITKVDLENQEELELVKDTMYFSISTNQVDYILITLK